MTTIVSVNPFEVFKKALDLLDILPYNNLPITNQHQIYLLTVYYSVSNKQDNGDILFIQKRAPDRWEIVSEVGRVIPLLTTRQLINYVKKNNLSNISIIELDVAREWPNDNDNITLFRCEDPANCYSTKKVATQIIANAYKNMQGRRQKVRDTLNKDFSLLPSFEGKIPSSSDNPKESYKFPGGPDVRRTKKQFEKIAGIKNTSSSRSNK
jgi:hypothetical protein